MDFKKQFTTCFRIEAQQRFNLLQTCSDLEATNLSSLALGKFTFRLITYFSIIEICLYSLYRKKKRLLDSEKRENVARLRENDDLLHPPAKP